LTGESTVLERKVLGILRGVDGALGTGALSFILDLSEKQLKEVLEILEDGSVVRRLTVFRHPAWLVPGGSAVALSARITEKLVGYAVSSFRVALGDLLTVLHNENLSVGERRSILLRAFHLAGEQGEEEVCALLLEDVFRLDGLSAAEVAGVLKMFEPRKMKGFDPVSAEAFIGRAMKILEGSREEAWVLTRLGELDFLRNRSSVSMERLSAALDLCMQDGFAAPVPVITDCLREFRGDFQVIEAIIDKVAAVVKWAESLDEDAAAVVVASAAALQAAFGLGNAAHETMLSAMKHFPSASGKARLAMAGYRALVCITQGHRKAAMTILRDGLNEAVTMGDQQAVVEILVLMTEEMKKRSGFTLRDLVSLLREVSKEVGERGDVHAGLFLLDNLVGLHARTLHFGDARLAAEKLALLLQSTGLPYSGSGRNVYLAYWNFLTGLEVESPGRIERLREFSEFLERLLAGDDPVEEARTMVRGPVPQVSDERHLHLLVLALEAFARGAVQSASVIAAALDAVYGRRLHMKAISWKFCLSGILSSNGAVAEDFLHTAQILARQMDELLLVWLLLRCRLSLDIWRDSAGRNGLLLMLAELDGFARDNAGEDAGLFWDNVDASGRLEQLYAASGAVAKGSLRELRDLLAGTGKSKEPVRLEDLSDVFARVSNRSEISASLEVMGRLTSADRVMVVKSLDGDVEMVEEHGTGKWRKPGREIREVLLERPGDRVWIDNFGVDPYGARSFLVIPAGRDIPNGNSAGEYVVVERDFPFREEDGTRNFLLDVLARQVEAALRFRAVQVAGCVDGPTGVMSGFSLVSRLTEFLSDTGEPISVLVMGVDHLDEMNRSMGWEAGAEIIRNVAETLRGVLRPSDVVGRLDRGIFGILLPSAAARDASKIAWRLCTAVSAAVLLPDGIPVTASVGTVSAGNGNFSPQDLLKTAGLAMLRAMEGGGGRVFSLDAVPGNDGNSKPGIFHTGDPGRDAAIYSAVMGLLVGGPHSPTLVAERLQEALESRAVILVSDGLVHVAGEEEARSLLVPMPRMKPPEKSSPVKADGREGFLYRYGNDSALAAVWKENCVPSWAEDIFTALSRLTKLLLFKD